MSFVCRPLLKRFTLASMEHFFLILKKIGNQTTLEIRLFRFGPSLNLMRSLKIRFILKSIFSNLRFLRQTTFNLKFGKAIFAVSQRGQRIIKL
jgi:hypothetical protein